MAFLLVVALGEVSPSARLKAVVLVAPDPAKTHVC